MSKNAKRPEKLEERERQVDILARTLYGEARGEPFSGLEAVACVVMNRVRRGQKRRNGYWWGTTVEEVCLKPWQFSCWNDNDPNRKLLERVKASDPVFGRCLSVARRALNRQLPDPTDGATHYHTRGVVPDWSFGKQPCVMIGHHLFYNNVE
ncbi:hypothetical protein JCM17960_17160 [Magnetospira thiophila]